VVAGTPADFRKFIADETEKWGKVAKFAGIKAIDTPTALSAARVRPLAMRPRMKACPALPMNAAQPAGTHPELPPFEMRVRIRRAELAWLWAPRSCWAWASSAVNDTTLCSASTSAAAVPRTCAMSSCEAMLSVAVPLPSRQGDAPYR
jgi:hypothetical protein